MEIYEKKLTVKSDYAAMNGYLCPSSMFAIMQDAAAADAALRGAGDDVTAHRGILWMVVHMRAQVVSLPAYGDDISVVTWPGGVKHGLFTRFYQLLDHRGSPVVSASGSWVLVDAATRSLVRAADLVLPQVITGREIDLPRRIKVPELPNKVSFTARYSDADINGHMNNAKYLDAAEDLLPRDYLMTHTLRRADADYLSEVLPGETLSLGWGEKDGDWYFQGETDSPCFRIKLGYR